MRSGWLIVAAIVLVGCGDGGRSRPQASPSVGARAATPRVERQAAGPVVAIGDLHGDLRATRAALRAAGAIDAADRWVGGELTVVQTGDTLDRGDDDRAVLDLLVRLRRDAERAGGKLVTLLGNHEIMNVEGNLSYVAEAAADDFGPSRRLAFAPGAEFARLLSEWPVIARVGDSVFVHGGVLHRHLELGIDAINRDTAAWLRGEREQPVVLRSEDAPVWTRLYSNAPGPQACAELERVLRELKAERMVVGHTPQPRGISSACGEKVWRIDTGMSSHYGGRVQVLRIERGRVSVRSGSGEM